MSAIDDLVTAAEKRIAEIDAEKVRLDGERERLAAAIAAARGQTVQPARPTWIPPSYPQTFPWPHTGQTLPYFAAKPRIDHGGLCACEWCVPPVTCDGQIGIGPGGYTTATSGATLRIGAHDTVRFVSDHFVLDA